MNKIVKDAPGAGAVHVDTPLGGAGKRVRGKPKAADGTAIIKAEPRSLYVHRNVVNAAEILDHFKGQGFAKTIPPEQLHVTITYSKAEVDWLAMGDNWSSDDSGNLVIPPGGPRMMERLGIEKDAVVMIFASSALGYRHEWMVEQGASWDWPDYQPHLTISFDAAKLDLAGVTPWQGKIVLGPEVFEELKQNWKDTLVEKAEGQFSTFFKVSGITDLGLVFGWGIVCTEGGEPYVDSHDNHIPEDAMVEATTDFMKGARVHGDMHVRGTTPELTAGQVVHSFPMTAEIAKAMGITTERTGWMVATAPDSAMLAKFRSGEYTGFSIGGEHIEIDGVPVGEA